jgi:hypothetical protein
VPILGIQQQQTEVGRIRLGVKVKTAAGKERPAKLDKLRFTSARKALLDEVARLYGGTVEAWQPPKGNSQWQVITNVTEVPVVIPPQNPAEGQWLEAWSAGGCVRRCDGVTERISNSPCMCKASDLPRSSWPCKMHTRIRVMLEDVPGLGCWRVDTGGYYAATELPGIAAFLAMAQGLVPGKLILDQRTVTRDGKTFNFAVPVLDVDMLTPKQLMSGRVPELVAAAASRSIDASMAAARTAIAATVDYPSLVDAARSVDALRDLFNQAGASGALTDELRALLEEKAQELASTAKASKPDDAPLVDAEIVDGEAWLATQDPAGEVAR